MVTTIFLDQFFLDATGLDEAHSKAPLPLHPTSKADPYVRMKNYEHAYALVDVSRRYLYRI